MFAGIKSFVQASSVYAALATLLVQSGPWGIAVMKMRPL